MKVIVMKPQFTIDVDCGIVRYVNDTEDRWVLYRCCMNCFDLFKPKYIEAIDATDCFSDMNMFQLKMFLAVVYNQISLKNTQSAIEHLVETVLEHKKRTENEGK